MIKQYLFYLIRWQLSTPILTLVLVVLADLNPLYATIIANLIGGLIFFWVDKIIFRRSQKRPIGKFVTMSCAPTAAGGGGATA